MTLLGQFITFALLVWFTMKYVWPPITKAIHDRQTRIADGLAAAERGVHELELAHHKAVEILRDAKIQAAEILDQAHKRAAHIVDESKERSREEGEKLIEIAKREIEQEMIAAKQILKESFVGIAVSGAESILQQHIDAVRNEQLLNQLAAEI